MSSSDEDAPSRGGLLILAHGDRVRAASPGLSAELGYADLAGRRLLQVMTRASHDAVLEAVTGLETIPDGRAVRYVELIRRNGTRTRASLELWRCSGHDDSTTAALLRIGVEPSARVLDAEQMASIIAHEVKNPLAGITAALEVLARRSNGNETQADIMRQSADRLRALDESLDELLLLIRPVSPTIESLDLLDVLRPGAERARAEFAQLDLALPARGPRVAADRRLSSRLFEHLLMEAARAATEPRRIRVEVTVTARVRVRVQHSGPPLAPEERSRVFDPYYMVRARGAGLQLPTVARLAEIQGGTAEVDHDGTLAIELPVADTG